LLEYQNYNTISPLRDKYIEGIMMTKTYDELREETQLNEFSIKRTGSTLFFASQVRAAGLRLETNIGRAKGSFSASKKAKTTDEKLDYMMDGMKEMSDAFYHQRVMLGNITGLTLSAALTQERSDKQMAKLMKGKGRR
jgi:hypothetical protein